MAITHARTDEYNWFCIYRYVNIYVVFCVIWCLWYKYTCTIFLYFMGEGSYYKWTAYTMNQEHWKSANTKKTLKRCPKTTDKAWTLWQHDKLPVSVDIKLNISVFLAPVIKGVFVCFQVYKRVLCSYCIYLITPCWLLALSVDVYRLYHTNVEWSFTYLQMVAIVCYWWWLYL